MIRYRFYVGTRDGLDSNKVADHARVRAYLVSVWGGYSAFDASGVWTDAGETYSEPSVVYEVLAPGDGTDLAHIAQGHAQHLRVLASQQCVLWTVERVQGGFASA